MLSSGLLPRLVTVDSSIQAVYAAFNFSKLFESAGSEGFEELSK